MSQASQFIISEFTNPSGEIVFRVTGWLDGTRIRKNFPTRAEASAERQALEIQRLQAETGIRTTATRLTDAQLHEAEATFRRLADAPKSLSFYLDFALANYRAPDREQTLVDAVTTYVAFKQREHDQKLLSISQLDHIRRHLGVLKKWFPAVLVSRLTPKSPISRELAKVHGQDFRLRKTLRQQHERAIAHIHPLVFRHQLGELGCPLGQSRTHANFTALNGAKQCPNSRCVFAQIPSDLGLNGFAGHTRSSITVIVIRAHACQLSLRAQSASNGPVSIKYLRSESFTARKIGSAFNHAGLPLREIRASRAPPLIALLEVSIFRAKRRGVPSIPQER